MTEISLVLSDEMGQYETILGQYLLTSASAVAADVAIVQASASASAASASAASNSALAASGSATTATGAATAASASAAAASTSASASNTSSINSATSASASAGSSSSAGVSATNAASSATAASVSAGNAATSATGAATSASNASAALVSAALKANNLSDLSSASAARGNLGLGTAGIMSFKNKLMNAGFTIGQRNYVSGTATTAANQYALDRWRVVTSGQNLSWTSVSPYNQITAPAGGVEQVIESVFIEADTYVLSWTGTATATVNGTAVAKNGTIALPAVTNATVRFSNGTVLNPQLERGTVATVFEFKPLWIELIGCKRYYQNMLAQMTAYTSAGLGMAMTMNYPVDMRAVPTITFSGGSYSNCSAIGAINQTSSGCRVQVVATATGALGFNDWLMTLVAEL